MTTTVSDVTITASWLGGSVFLSYGFVGAPALGMFSWTPAASDRAAFLAAVSAAQSAVQPGTFSVGSVLYEPSITLQQCQVTWDGTAITVTASWQQGAAHGQTQTVNQTVTLPSATQTALSSWITTLRTQIKAKVGL